MTSTAAASPTSTSSGATSRDGTRRVLNDSVGSLLTITGPGGIGNPFQGAGRQPMPCSQFSRR